MEARVHEYSTNRKQGIKLTYSDVLSVEFYRVYWKEKWKNNLLTINRTVNKCDVKILNIPIHSNMLGQV